MAPAASNRPSRSTTIAPSSDASVDEHAGIQIGRAASLEQVQDLAARDGTGCRGSSGAIADIEPIRRRDELRHGVGRVAQDDESAPSRASARSSAV